MPVAAVGASIGGMTVLTAHRIADGWTYGFAEMDKAQGGKIAAAKRVGNPGCWPQGAIATLRPLIEAGLIPADFPLTVHGISGYTGVGEVQRAFGKWVIDCHLPNPGTPTQPVEAGFMANAWVRMRHPDYDGLREMLDEVGRTVKVRAT